MEGMAEVISKVSGKTVVYQQVPEGHFRLFLPQHGFADVLVEMMLYQQDFECYGPDTNEKCCASGRECEREGEYV